jgi:hypothetical protein
MNSAASTKAALTVIAIMLALTACKEGAAPPAPQSSVPGAAPAPEAKQVAIDTIHEGVYQPNNQQLAVNIVKDKAGVPRIGYVGIHLPATLAIDKVLLKSGAPFGTVLDNKLVFQFPVMLSFSPSNNVSTESGGKLNVAYFKGEIAATTTDGLSCLLTRINSLDNADQFTARDINLNPPDENAKLDKTYTLILMPKSKTD